MWRFYRRGLIQRVGSLLDSLSMLLRFSSMSCKLSECFSGQTEDVGQVGGTGNVWAIESYFVVVMYSQNSCILIHTNELSNSMKDPIINPKAKAKNHQATHYQMKPVTKQSLWLPGLIGNRPMEVTRHFGGKTRGALRRSAERSKDPAEHWGCGCGWRTKRVERWIGFEKKNHEVLKHPKHI